MSIDEKIQNENIPEDTQDNQQYGLMEKIRNYANSKKGKITAGIGALALAGSIYATQPQQANAEEMPEYCNIVECVEGGVKLPDLSDAEYVGKQKRDKFSNIDGKETIQVGYLKDGYQILVSYFEFNTEQPYGFGIRDTDGNMTTYANGNANKIFEQKGGSGDKIDIDIEKYKE